MMSIFSSEVLAVSPSRKRREEWQENVQKKQNFVAPDMHKDQKKNLSLFQFQFSERTKKSKHVSRAYLRPNRSPERVFLVFLPSSLPLRCTETGSLVPTL